MNIVKRLILNNIPKDVPNGSIGCAMNMMVDDTGSFLMNDIGFKKAISFGFSERIVGCISCDTEIVVFVHNRNNNQSKVVRVLDTGAVIQVDCDWKYNGGKISGTYTRNYKGDLIIAVGEYDGEVDVPLKTWNLDKSPVGETYALEENIPVYDVSNSIGTSGNLVCGVYTFFIRFKVSDYDYTKWFQITGDINITQEVSSKKYNHVYLKQGQGSMADTLEHESASSFNYNKNGISNKNINLTVSIKESVFKGYQIGYIIKRNSEIKGRIQGDYDIEYIDVEDESGVTVIISKTKISVSNNTYLEEISVEELLENPHQFLNVKNVINYNNRLYIANYKEHDNEDLSKISIENVQIKNDIEQSETEESSDSTSTSNLVWSINMVLRQDAVGSYGRRKEDSILLENIVTDSDGYVRDTSSIITTIFNKLYYKLITSSDISRVSTDTIGNYYWFIQNNDNIYDANSAICLASNINDSEASTPPNWNWNFTVPVYSVKLTKDNIIIEYNNNSWSLLSNNNINSCILYYFKDNLGHTNYCFGISDPLTMAQGLNPPKKMPNNIFVSFNGDAVSTIPTENPDDDSEEGTGESVPPGNNVRTLIPYQKYNFFIHYIRPDGSVTLGFPILEENYVQYKLNSGNTVIRPVFNVSKPNDNYIGYFISYEDVESNVDSVCITFVNGTTTKSIGITNFNYLYDIDTIRGVELIFKGVSYTIPQATLKYIENKLTYNHIETVIDSSFPGIDYPTSDCLGYIIRNLLNIYNKKVKTLYRLTRNIYTWDEDIQDTDYLPGFYDQQLIITYKGDTSSLQADPAKGLIIVPDNKYVIGFETLDEEELGASTRYNVTISKQALYSAFPTSAANIKQDYEQAAITLTYTDNNDEVSKNYVNVLITPDKLSDLLEVQASYTSKPSKSYTNYSSNYISVFDKTIYRSDVISDESNVNRFRHFGINNYKNILENKGKIVNLVGIGLYFIVHTENSLFVFDRTPKLTTKSQLDIPDVFSIDYQEVLPSSDGFGGLRDKEEAIVTKHGYIWYDYIHNTIFNYENGKITILSADIYNYIKYINVDYIRFGEDINHNRLFICVYTKDSKLITFSYSFNTNSFISAHNFKFTNNYRTYTKSYFFDNDGDGRSLFTLDDTLISKYGPDDDLVIAPSDCLFPVYENTNKSYVDVVFNDNYELPKVLEHIMYVLNIIDNTVSNYNIIDGKLNKRFSGDIIKIYTDETDSGELDISVSESNLNNTLTNYKYPYFDKGHWNLNYFRNKISVPVTIQELETYAETYPTNSKKLIDANTYKYADNQVKVLNSDNRSLIYGKYFVVRFIFNDTHRIKLESVIINTNTY